MALLFLEKVKTNQKQFADGVKALGRYFNVNPNWFMALFNSETGGTFRPDIRNFAGSGAVGLIQFMPATARDLGTTTQYLGSLSNVEQLAWVKEYVEYAMKIAKVDKIRDYDDLYLLIFYPIAVGKPDDYVIGKPGSQVYIQNAGIDVNTDGKITVADFRKFIRKKIPKTDLWQFVGRHRYGQIAIGVAAFGVVAILIIAWRKGWFKKIAG